MQAAFPEAPTRALLSGLRGSCRRLYHVLHTRVLTRAGSETAEGGDTDRPGWGNLVEGAVVESG